jgi:hypothetical protein
MRFTHCIATAHLLPFGVPMLRRLCILFGVPKLRVPIRNFLALLRNFLNHNFFWLNDSCERETRASCIAFPWVQRSMGEGEVAAPEQLDGAPEPLLAEAAEDDWQQTLSSLRQRAEASRTANGGQREGADDSESDDDGSFIAEERQKAERSGRFRHVCLRYILPFVRIDRLGLRPTPNRCAHPLTARRGCPRSLSRRSFPSCWLAAGSCGCGCTRRRLAVASSSCGRRSSRST